MKDRSIAVRALALVLAFTFSVGQAMAAIAGPELPNPGDTGVSKQEQIQVGQKAMAEVYQQIPVLPDSSPETRYVQQLGKKLAAVIPPQNSWPYQFHVVQQKEINAFALPGGPIFINVGTITAADNEAELAGVMAHEMSHVYMQHSVKQMRKNAVPNILAGVGQILGQMIGGVGGAVTAIGGQMIGGVLSMKYSRADEAQADAVGAIIMWKVNYDPRYLAMFFQKLEQQGGSGGPQFLSDHPNPGNRMEAIQKEIVNWPRKNFQVNSPAFVQVKQVALREKAYTAQQIAQGTKTGEWARANRQTSSIPPNLPATTQPASQTSSANGDISNISYSQVQPSGNFTETRNNIFQISYPDNWQAFQSQGGGGLTIAPPAAVSRGSVAYGVVINAIRDPNATSIDKATQDLINSLIQSNPGMRVSGQPQPIRVNGLEGRSVDLTGASPVARNGQPERERDWLVTVARSQGGIVYLVFIAPESEFDRLRPTYEAMLRSLHLS